MNTKTPRFVPVNVKTLKIYGFDKKVQSQVFDNIAKKFTGIITPETTNGNVYLKQEDILRELKTRHNLDTIEGQKVLQTFTTGKNPLIQIHYNRDLNTKVVTPTKYFWQNQ